MILAFFRSQSTQLLIKSITTVSFISTLCGVAAYLVNKSFWAAFCLGTAVQFIAGYVVSVITANDYKSAVVKAELDKLEKLSTIVNCAYCSTPNVVTFLPDEVPSIVCDKCQNVSSVKLHFTVARTTTSVDTMTTTLKEPQKNHNIQY